MAVDIRLPLFPECRETCGNCGQSEVIVLDVHVRPGDHVRFDDNITEHALIAPLEPDQETRHW